MNGKYHTGVVPREYKRTLAKQKNILEEKDMTKMEYAKQVAAIVNGEAKEIEKANGVIWTGIICGDGNIRPTVYIDDIFETGKTPEEAAELILQRLSNVTDPGFTIPDMSNYKDVKPKLRLRLYNEKTSADIFRPADEYGFDDLILIPYVQIDQQAAAKVTRQMLDHWGVPTAILFADAMENTEKLNFNVRPMSETMRALAPEMAWMFPKVEEGTIEPQYTITIDSKLFGAIGAIVKRNELMQKFPDGYYVLPSSIHEVIVMPKIVNTLPKSELDNMVLCVNKEQVTPEEMLAWHAYEF